MITTRVQERVDVLICLDKKKVNIIHVLKKYQKYILKPIKILEQK
jgi:hypothetical protein